ncbi:MAG: 4Fe-4S binding protein [Chitinophagales bacterium]
MNLFNKEIQYAGLTLKNPFVVASGPPGATVQRLKACEDNGAGGVSIKLTFTKQPFYGKLRMYSVPGEASIVCHDRRLDMEEGFELVRKGKEQTGLVLFANMTHPAEDLEGWQTLAKGFEQAGADALELNLICPNITFSERRMGQHTDHSHGAVIGQDPVAIENVVRACKEVVKIPVIAKLTSNVSDITVTGAAAARGGADGICMAGGQSGLPKVDLATGKPLGSYCADGYSFGSMGGPAILNQSFALTAQLARALKVPVIAGGGLSTWEDALMFMMYGGRLVTACTVIMWEGFRVIRQIVSGMERYMEKQGYSSWDEIIGLSLKYLKPAKDLQLTPGRAVIEEGKCIQCLNCVGLGHCDAIVEENGGPQVVPEKCVACGICVGVCPQEAISIKEG